MNYNIEYNNSVYKHTDTIHIQSNFDEKEYKTPETASIYDCNICYDYNKQKLHHQKDCPITNIAMREYFLSDTLKQETETFSDYWERVKVNGTCTFCGLSGHTKKECTVLKETVCQACGFSGHTLKLCNKIKKNPKTQQIGKCTFCKEWGHWVVVCKDRQEKYGDYKFPDGVDVDKVYSFFKNK